MIFAQSPFFLYMIPGFDVLCHLFFCSIISIAGSATDFQRNMKLCEFRGFSVVDSTLLTYGN